MASQQQHREVYAPPGPAARASSSLGMSFLSYVPTGPRARVFGSLWIFGLLSMLLLPAPFKVNESDMKQYNLLSESADVETLDSFSQARNALIRAENALYDVEVFFWRFRSPYNKLVPKRRRDRDLALRAFKDIEAVRNKKLAKARAKLGLWSDFGVTEARTSFWKSFESGKVFATRQSFWDGFFALLSGAARDESMVEFLIRWFMMGISNFTIGMIMAVCIFCWRLPSLIASFDAGYLSGTFFFAVCAVGAVAVVVTYLLLLTGAAAGTVYVAAKTAGVGNLRLGGGRRQRPAFVRYHHHQQ
ncbi:hypothetical protein NFJ02_38g95240 [Pycnococcus provasolii]